MEVKVEAKLAAAYFKTGRIDKLLEIVQGWSQQHAIIKVAHAEIDIEAAQAFSSSVRSAMKRAGEMISFPDFHSRFKINENTSFDCDEKLTTK